MRYFVFFKGSATPHPMTEPFATLAAAKEYMETARYTGIVVIQHPPVKEGWESGAVEVVWYNKGVRQ